jgi:two-component system, sensor histidine kinase and response regulator
VAERLAHTVKGTAGNLGAGPVQSAAGALEKALRDQADTVRVESLRAQLGDALARLGSALRPWLADAVPVHATQVSVAPVAMDQTALKTMVERWTRMLAECDTRTGDDLEREGRELRVLFGGPEAFHRFADLVTGYEFESALTALRRAAGDKGL